MNSKKFILLLSGVLIISGCGAGATKDKVADSFDLSGLSFETKPTEQKTLPNSAPSANPILTPTKPMEFDAKKHYTALLHTSVGDITVALNFGETPNTVKNFVDLSQRNYYENVIFHRVVKGFMIQGGDPTGTGRGGPGYKFDDEQFSGEYTRGTLAMANSGPNTNGSQFFIMQEDRPDLPKNYTIFGHVTKGIEVVDKIANAAVTANAFGEESVPVKPEKIVSVEITEN